MTNSEWPHVLTTCDELTKLMDGCSPGVNPAALAQVLSLCTRMRGPSSHINDRLNKIESAAHAHFSACQWATHPRGPHGFRNEIVQTGLSLIREEAQRQMRLQADGQ